ncbi:MAG: glycoside hydrolase family 15 protein [Firmicutes bacterium]|nr:glycoside hydrolase family 15 protein [Bacillota bacterium]
MKFYGFLSNCHTAALVSPEGSIDWLTFPRYDSPAIFCKLLGTEDHGYFSVRPDVAHSTVTQQYVENTNVLRTSWEAPSGRMVTHDYLAVGRPELRRLIRSELPFTVEFQPRFHYGLIHPAPKPVNSGAIFRNPLAREALVLAINAEPQSLREQIQVSLTQGVWRFPPGHYELIVQYVADDEERLVEAADVIEAQMAQLEEDMENEELNASLQENIAFWQHYLTMLPPYQGPHADAFHRSLLVLYGLTYQTNGAIIAAPTTSLPETVGEARQWDYRFAWVRDGSYAAEALLTAGDHVGSRRFLDFLLNCIDLQGKPFQAPFFHVDGTLIRGERDLEWLPGFRGSVPCREGNAATRQLQLDIEGDFLWTVWRYYEATQDTEFLRFYWHRIRVLVHWVQEHFRQKDASLWEFRDQDDYYTHSQLMCWVSLTYGAKMADAVGESLLAKHWRTAAEHVRHHIEHDGYNEALGSYTQAFGGNTVDAALLVMPLYGYCEVTSPRFLGTLRQIETQLVSGHWVYRYAADMFGTAAHPFVLASFWLARVYILLGRVAEAEAIINGILAQRTDLGLLGEHADQESGEPRGNFPQGFSHLGLIMALHDLWQAKAGKP